MLMVDSILKIQNQIDQIQKIMRIKMPFLSFVNFQVQNLDDFSKYLSYSGDFWMKQFYLQIKMFSISSFSIFQTYSLIYFQRQQQSLHSFPQFYFFCSILIQILNLPSIYLKNLFFSYFQEDQFLISEKRFSMISIQHYWIYFCFYLILDSFLMNYASSVLFSQFFFLHQSFFLNCFNFPLFYFYFYFYSHFCVSFYSSFFPLIYYFFLQLSCFCSIFNVLFSFYYLRFLISFWNFHFLPQELSFCYFQFIFYRLFSFYQLKFFQPILLLFTFFTIRKKIFCNFLISSKIFSLIFHQNLKDNYSSVAHLYQQLQEQKIIEIFDPIQELTPHGNVLQPQPFFLKILNNQKQILLRIVYKLFNSIYSQNKRYIKWILKSLSHYNLIKHNISLINFLVMSFETIKKLFKNIHRLSFKESYLASIVKENLRTHFDIYKKAKRQTKAMKYKQRDGELLQAFERFIEQATMQNAQFSDKAKMKLIELCYGLNMFVDTNFQLRKDYKSAQIKHLQSYEQYIGLQTEQQKEFVRKLIKKVLSGDETYSYTNLTDFFKDFRSQTSNNNLNNILKTLDQPTQSHLIGIFQNRIPISPDYRTIYNVYFSKEEPFSVGLQSYIRSRQIMIDFDNFQFAPSRNQMQLQRQAERRKQIAIKRLQAIKEVQNNKEKLKNSQQNQQKNYKKIDETKNYNHQKIQKLEQDKKHQKSQHKSIKLNSKYQKNKKGSNQFSDRIKQAKFKEKKEDFLKPPQKQAASFGKQQMGINQSLNGKISHKTFDKNQKLVENSKTQNSKKQTKTFFRKK